MVFIIKTQRGYIKRTSNFGTFHGSIVLTDDAAEAKRFSRKADAEARARVAEFRTKEADNLGKWYSREGFDRKKFGETLTTEVLEI